MGVFWNQRRTSDIEGETVHMLIPEGGGDVDGMVMGEMGGKRK